MADLSLSLLTLIPRLHHVRLFVIFMDLLCLLPEIVSLAGQSRYPRWRKLSLLDFLPLSQLVGYHQLRYCTVLTSRVMFSEPTIQRFHSWQFAWPSHTGETCQRPAATLVHGLDVTPASCQIDPLVRRSSLQSQ